MLLFVYYYKQYSTEQLIIFKFINFSGNKFSKSGIFEPELNIILIELAFQKTCRWIVGQLNLHLGQQCMWILGFSHTYLHCVKNAKLLF